MEVLACTRDKVRQLNTEASDGVLLDPEDSRFPFVNLDKIFRLEPKKRDEVLDIVQASRHARMSPSWLGQKVKRKHAVSAEKELKPYYLADPRNIPLAIRIAKGDFVFDQNDVNRISKYPEKLKTVLTKDHTKILETLIEFQFKPLLYAVKTNDLKFFKQSYSVKNFRDNIENIWTEINKNPSPERIKMLKHFIEDLYNEGSQTFSSIIHKLKSKDQKEFLQFITTNDELKLSVSNFLKQNPFDEIMLDILDFMATKYCSEMILDFANELGDEKLDQIISNMLKSYKEDLGEFTKFNGDLFVGLMKIKNARSNDKPISTLVDYKTYENIFLNAAIHNDVNLLQYLLETKLISFDEEATKVKFKVNDRNNSMVKAFDLAVLHGNNQAIDLLLSYFSDNEAIKLLITARLIDSIPHASISSYKLLLSKLNPEDRNEFIENSHQRLLELLPSAFQQSHIKEEKANELIKFTFELKNKIDVDKRENFLVRFGYGLSQKLYINAELIMNFIRRLDEGERGIFLKAMTNASGLLSLLFHAASVSTQLAQELIEYIPEDDWTNTVILFNKKNSYSDNSIFQSKPEFIGDFLRLCYKAGEPQWLTGSFDPMKKAKLTKTLKITAPELREYLYRLKTTDIDLLFSDILKDHPPEYKDIFLRDYLKFFKLSHFIKEENIIQAENTAQALFKNISINSRVNLLKNNNFALVMNACELNATRLLKLYSESFSKEEWATLMRIGNAYKKITPVLRIALALENLDVNDNESISTKAAFALANLYEDSQQALDFVFHRSKAYQGRISSQPIHDLLYKFKPCDSLINWDKKTWQRFLACQAANYDPLNDFTDIRELLGEANKIQTVYDELKVKNLVKDFYKYSPDELYGLILDKYQQEDKDLELARICEQLRVPEESFNLALDTRTDIGMKLTELQKDDQIPEIGREIEAVDGKKYFVIDGVDLGEEYKDFYLRKIDRLDPRILFVGKYVACCNYIGGETEEMAIAQANSPYGGCYVLAKKSRDNLIDPNHDRIVAKTSVWKSKPENIVFNSWESLHDYSHLGLKFIQNAAVDILKKNESMERISLGKNQFKYPLPLRDKAEKAIDKRTKSPDSDCQYLVAMRTTTGLVKLATEVKVENVSTRFAMSS